MQTGCNCLDKVVKIYLNFCSTVVICAVLLQAILSMQCQISVLLSLPSTFHFNFHFPLSLPSTFHFHFPCSLSTFHFHFCFSFSLPTFIINFHFPLSLSTILPPEVELGLATFVSARHRPLLRILCKSYITVKDFLIRKLNTS